MTTVSRLIAIVTSLAAGWALVALASDRGTRSARWFTAIGFWGLAVTSGVAMFLRPLEHLTTALLVTAVARALQSWVAVGVILIVRQQYLLVKRGMR
jgi:hypothetical protein